MNTVSETAENGGNQITKSVGSGGSGSTVSGGKTRRNSIGITSFRKSVGEEGKPVPIYLRASTGSCHDFCKFGKHNEHAKSVIPINFKRSTVVDKEKVAKTEVPVERKKTTSVKKIVPLTYPKIRVPAEPVEETKRVVSLASKKAQNSKPVLSTNGKATENVVKMIKRSTSCSQPSRVSVNHGVSAGSNDAIKKKDKMTPKSAPVKKVPTESHSLKASFHRATSLKGIKYRSVKQVTPLKDQNRLQKTEAKKSSSDKIRAKNLHVSEASEIKPQITEFDVFHPSVASVNSPVCNSSESFSGGNVIKQKSTIIHPVYESSELFPQHFEDALIVESSEVLEELSIAPTVFASFQSNSKKEFLEAELLLIPPMVESLQSNSEKEYVQESLIAPSLSESSESFYDEEVVLEDMSDYTDEEEEDNEKVFANRNNDEMETSKKISRKGRGRMVISEDKDDEAVKLRFRRGKILDLQAENNNTPRRLKFRRGKVVDGKEVKQHISKKTYEKKSVDKLNESISARESVVLKHQGEQEKKDAQGLFNNVIEETASKLAETRKSKVKALVGAFETVISLQDGKL